MGEGTARSAGVGLEVLGPRFARGWGKKGRYPFFPAIRKGRVPA